MLENLKATISVGGAWALGWEAGKHVVMLGRRGERVVCTVGVSDTV